MAYCSRSLRLEVNLGRQLCPPVSRHIVWLSAVLAQRATQTAGGRRDACAGIADCLGWPQLLSSVLTEVGDVPGQPCVEVIELRMVEGVEHLQAQLDVTLTVAAEREALEDRQVGDVDAGPPDESARQRTGVDIRKTEFRDVERRPALRRTTIDVGLRVACGDQTRAFRPRT